MSTLHAPNFNLKLTIESGQIFRWKKKENKYYVCIRNTLFAFQQDGDNLYWYAKRSDDKPVSEEVIIRMFRLDEDYEEIIESIQTDEMMKKITKRMHGLRLIRQDPWECLISYIASAVSSIPKHSASLQKLCEKYGEELSYDNQIFHTFPSPGQLNNEDFLRSTGLGFRSPYILKANNVATDINLHGLSALNYEECINSLLLFPGIGRKIANCIALFSLEQNTSFPVDIWIQRAVQELYMNSKCNELECEDFGRSYFHPFPGYAQQFLYHWRRKS